MRWYVLLPAILAGLVLLIALIGLLLPKAHVATRKITLRQSPGAIFTAITNWQDFPNWREGVTGVKEWTGDGGAVGWTEIMKRDQIPLQVLEATAPSKLIVKIADPNLPWGGTWTYDVQSVDPTQSTITITENGEVYNPIFRFVAKFIMGHTMTMDAYMRSLGKKFGQEVNPA